MILSKRAEAVSPSLTLEITSLVNKLKSSGENVIGFGVGEPDFNTPLNIQNAAFKAIKEGHTKYTSSSGIIELKRAVSKKLFRDNDLKYDTNEIIISNGAKQCIANALFAILNPGDEVLIGSPYWVSYPELVKLAGGVPVFVNTNVKDNFKITAESLNNYLSKKTKAIIINSPNNPTGSVLDEETLKGIALFAQKNDLIIISDEIYEKLIYGNTKHISIASLSSDAKSRTITINGVSKSYAMTGWRIGYAAGPANIIKLMSGLQSHFTSNPNSIAQYAALEALNGNQDSLEKMKIEFKKRRNYMVSKLKSIHYIDFIEPEGAFYVMVNIKNLFNKSIENILINSSTSFADALLKNEKTAVIPGIAFGNDDYVRLSYATSMENIVEGLDRIEKFINKLI